MTTDEVLSVLDELGIQVVLGDDGQPRLAGNTKEAPPSLLPVLRWHKKEIVSRLAPAPVPERKAEPMREWLWRTGHGYIADELTPQAWHPVGAFWWRIQGEMGWKPVPCRNPEGVLPPKGVGHELRE